MQLARSSGVVGRAAAAPRRAALATHGSVAARAGRARGVRGPPPEPALEVSVIVPGDQELSPVATTQSGGIGIAGAALLAAAAFGFVWSKLRARGADMGYYGGGDMMRNVNMVQMEELSPDIIAAARARRSRERANHKLDLEDVELPENHPWATRKPMSQEQEAAIQARLQARPRGTQRGSAGGEQRRQRMRE